MTVPALKAHESFLVLQSQDPMMSDDRFVARNFRLDERLPDARAAYYAANALPASDLPSWAVRHADYLEDRIQRPTPPSGPPATLDPNDLRTCPETFGPDALAVDSRLLDLGLSLVRVVGLFRVAEAVGLDEGTVRSALEDPLLRDGIIDRWALKQPVEPIFATLWQDVKDLVPATGDPPPEWVMKYKVSDLPTTGSIVTRPITVPTELDSGFFPPFCPSPAGSGVGRVVDLGLTITSPWPEVLHPTVRWRGVQVAQLGVISRPVPSLAIARSRHIKLIQTLCGRPDYATVTDADLL